MRLHGYLKLKTIFFLAFILIILLPLATRGEEHPLIFPTRAAALKYGCKILSIKQRTAENGIVWRFDGHDLLISIYDFENDGKLVRKNQLQITSWYQKAKIYFDDLLGNGVKFIKVESEGNTGTGTLQMIHSYWGWKKDRFLPVFFETKSYYISGQYLEDLKVNYQFRKKTSKQVSVVLDYRYRNNNPKHKSKYSWTESLIWSDALFSFYTPELEKRKLIVAKNPIQKRIIEARLNYMKRRENMKIISVDLLNEIGMMQIFYDD